MARARGMSLREMLHRNQADIHALVAAARELRRVHQVPCSYYSAPWSHGDLHLDNILYDVDSARAVLIDFDTRHELRVSQTLRQSDDLNVLLLELIASPDEKWSELAAAFVEEYHEASVLNELVQQLLIPRGFARILMYARTNCVSLRRIEPRLQRLREIVHRVATSAGVCPEQNSVATDHGGEPLVGRTVGNRA
jgi:Ser/Thr protein kinase RdoA (MazF antagonist)